MRVVVLSAVGLLLSGTVAYSQTEVSQIAAYAAKLPPPEAPVYDEGSRETLAASAISCTDRPEEEPLNRNAYLWQYVKPATLPEGYDKSKAFFGCTDWHSAAGSIWMLLSLLKQDPKLGVASDIKDIDTNHFKKTNMDGEFAFFNDLKGQSQNFEKPYGYVWYLKLYGEAKSWPTPDGKKLADAMQPLAKWMSERLVFYFYNLKYPYRTGTEANTAWSMSLALDYAYLAEDTTLATGLQANTLRLFAKDKDCPTALEPASGDLVSACLSEAALVSRVMEGPAFAKWIEAFLPPVYAEGFQVYVKPIDTSHASATGPDSEVQMTVKAHEIGLNFQRATDLLMIAYALPKGDPRITVYRNLAAASAHQGYDKFGDAGYEGQHWLGTYAVLYQNENMGPAPLGPPKPKTPPDPKDVPTGTS